MKRSLCPVYILCMHNCFCQLSESSVDFNNILLLMFKYKRARLSQWVYVIIFVVDLAVMKIILPTMMGMIKNMAVWPILASKSSHCHPASSVHQYSSILCYLSKFFCRCGLEIMSEIEHVH